ncbi:MAG: hypothetical protein KBD78_01115 [Oligoflexales bacterium]|nr:hypothetical protein [Oligoflexales bacterium]
MNINSIYSNSFFENQKDRLRETSSWFPIPALLSAFATLVLLGHLNFSLNHRLGSPANIINLNQNSIAEGSLWISLSIYDEKLLIITSSEYFLVSFEDLRENKLTEFISFLDNYRSDLKADAAIRLKKDVLAANAVLSVDQNLKYAHVLPIIQALAKAKITKYGFETKNINVEENIPKNL